MSFKPEFPKEQPLIYKYNLGYIDRGILTTKIEGPRLLNVLDIQEQGYDLVLWAEVDTAQMGGQYTIQIYSVWTGDPPPGEGWSYFKTIQSQIDGLVYHLYIKHN
jgi:hypothetical protein